MCLALSMGLIPRSHPINPGREAQLLLPASTFPSPTNADLPRTSEPPAVCRYKPPANLFFPTINYCTSTTLVLHRDPQMSGLALHTEAVSYFDSVNVHDRTQLRVTNVNSDSLSHSGFKTADKQKEEGRCKDHL